MKRLIVILLFTFSYYVFPQTTMVINKTNGTNDSLLLSEIKNITFKITPPSTLANGLIDWYPFNGDANDSVGANNGTVAGATLVSDRFNNSNSAYYFSKVGDRISVPYNSTLFPDTFSISCWVYHYGTPGGGGFILRAGNGSTDSWRGWSMAFVAPINQLRFDDYTGSNYNGRLISPDSVKLYLWNYIVVTRNTSTAKLYINGTMVDQLTGLTQYAKPTSTPLSFGNSNDRDTDYLNGIIADVRIYNRILTQTEISSLYSEPNPFHTSGQVNRIVKGF